MERKRDSFFLQNKKQKPQKLERVNNNDRNQKDNKNVQVKARQQEFDANREVKEKKPFDKKTYRLKKYSKKYKLEQWEEQRKKKLLHNYYKETKNDNSVGTYKSVSFDEDMPDGSGTIGRYVKHPDLIEQENSIEKNKKKDPYHKAKEEYKKIKQDKLQKKEEMKKAKEERNKKLEEYKKKKQDRFKKLSKKNKKGQPMMKGRLEMLLEKIQQGK